MMFSIKSSVSAVPALFFLLFVCRCAAPIHPRLGLRAILIQETDEKVVWLSDLQPMNNQANNIDDSDVEFFCDSTRIQSVPRRAEKDSAIWNRCRTINGDTAFVVGNNHPLLPHRPIRHPTDDYWKHHSRPWIPGPNPLKNGIQFCFSSSKLHGPHEMANPDFNASAPILDRVQASTQE